VHIPDDGYVDDVFVCVKVLKKWHRKVEKLWDRDEEPDEVVDCNYKKNLEFLDQSDG